MKYKPPSLAAIFCDHFFTSLGGMALCAPPFPWIHYCYSKDVVWLHSTQLVESDSILKPVGYLCEWVFRIDSIISCIQWLKLQAKWTFHPANSFKLITDSV